MKFFTYPSKFRPFYEFINSHKQDRHPSLKIQYLDRYFYCVFPALTLKPRFDTILCNI